MIATVLSLAFVNVTTLELVGLVLAIALLARTYHGTVHRNADLLATAVALATRIGQSAGTIPQFVIRRALAAKGSHGVDAHVGAAAVVAFALVNVDADPRIVPRTISGETSALEGALEIHAQIGAASVFDRALISIDAGSLVLRQFVAHRTGAEMAADGVGAVVRALAVFLSTLVDVQASRLVGVQIVTFVAGAHVTAEQVHTVVGAVVATGQALVHVYAGFLVIRHQDVAGRALAVIATLGVHARVRTTGVDVVLELLALVDILAGPLIALQSITERTGATSAGNSIGTIFFLMTVMRTVAVVALTTVYQNAGSVISLQSVSRRTRATESADQVHAGVRTSCVLGRALVNIVAESRILRILRETDVARAVETAGNIQALMSAIVPQLQALVDVHAGRVVLR